MYECKYEYFNINNNTFCDRVSIPIKISVLSFLRWWLTSFSQDYHSSFSLRYTIEFYGIFSTKFSNTDELI